MKFLRSFRWPLLAIGAWSVSWGLLLCLIQAGIDAFYSVIFAFLFNIILSLKLSSTMRRVVIIGGFHASFLLCQDASVISMMPPYAWLIMLFVLALLYPASAWSDAPFFPTHRDALTGIYPLITLAKGARILDAGCGLGHGMTALREIYPMACHHGIERSRPLRLICSIIRPWAKIYQGDFWKFGWSSYDLIYLFQRPESMNRALEKAHQELRKGSWVISLAFEAPGFKPFTTMKTTGGLILWVYKITKDER